MFQLSNTFLCLTGIGSIVMLSLIPSIYKNRYKIMGKQETCRIPNKEEEEYFLG